MAKHSHPHSQSKEKDVPAGLFLRAERARREFSFFGLGRTLAILFVAGYVLYSFFGVPNSLLVLILSFEMFSHVLASYVKFLRIRSIGGFSKPSEFTALAREIESCRLVAAGISLVFSALSLALSYVLFPAFFSGIIYLFGTEARFYYFLGALVLLRSARIISPYAKQAWYRGMPEPSDYNEAASQILLVDKKAENLEFFPVAMLILALSFLFRLPIFAIGIFSAGGVILGLVAIFELSKARKETISKRRLSPKALPGEKIVSSFFGTMPLEREGLAVVSEGAAGNEENSIVFTTKRMIFASVPLPKGKGAREPLFGSTSQSPKTRANFFWNQRELSRQGKSLVSKGLGQVLANSCFYLNYGDISRATLRKGIWLEISSSAGKTRQYLLIDRDESGPLEARLRAVLGERFLAIE